MPLGLQAAYGTEAMQQQVRQRIMDQLAEAEQQRKREAEARQLIIENAQRDRQLTVSEKNQTAMETDRADRLAEQTRANKVSGALRLAPLLRKGQSVTPADAQTLTEANMGSLVTQTPETLASRQYRLVAPGTMQTTETAAKPGGFAFGGTQLDDERAAAAAQRAVDAAANRSTATERADADRQMRLELARLAASGKAGSQALSDELKKSQLDAAKEKAAAAAGQRASAQQATQSALDTAERLLVHPGFGAATGAWEPQQLIEGQDRINFNEERDNLVALLTLPNLGLLKGPMSNQDVLFVKQMATQLGNRRLSADATRAALERAKLFLQSKLQEAGPATGTDAAQAADPYDAYLQRHAK